MQKPVYLLTVQEAHKEYKFLTDQIWAKYEQLGEYGVVGTPTFNAETCELGNLLALPATSNSWNCIGPRSSSIENTFQIKITGRQFG